MIDLSKQSEEFQKGHNAALDYVLNLWRDEDFKKRHAIFDFLDDDGQRHSKNLVENTDDVIKEVTALILRKKEWLEFTMKNWRSDEEKRRLNSDEGIDVKLCELLAITHSILHPGVAIGKTKD